MPCNNLCFLRNIRRCASTKTSPFSNTVLLPKTSFQAKVTAQVVSQEKSIQEKCKFGDLYQWQRTHNTGEEFILHDGPPYANGDVHVGHALNKILKDITNRYKMMCGHKVHYVPGWDCHGLPIEMKAVGEFKGNLQSPQKIRKAAKNFARNTIERQKVAFQRWGVMADWSDRGCYYTYNKEFEAAELSAFHDMYKNGLIYRDFKPVFWSPSSRTALAEAELEYNPQHKSRSVYFTCPLKNSAQFNHLSAPGLTLHVLVWTTQPWTIPANRAVCYSPSETYCVVKSANHPNKLFLIARNNLESLHSIFDSNLEVIDSIEGYALYGAKYQHPMDMDRFSSLLPSEHVTSEKGTGFVHIAPAHGVEDFALAIQHGLDVASEVDEEGRFTDDAGFNLVGKYIFSDGNEAVIDHIKRNDNLIMEYMYTHSYPYDWRTKKPIFVKTSRQWFVDTESLKGKSSELLKDIRIIPDSGRASMMSHLKVRTFWCISRQRSWGVPIPVFYHKHEGESLLSENIEMLLTEKSMQHIISVIQTHGSDAWWDLPMPELLPQSVIDDAGFVDAKPDDFETGKDILDIWFDSGLTWTSVLRNGSSAPIADIYLEGKDQYGGWFQSSLLTSCALQNVSPYKNILVHGFVLSESGQKMSKSLGNVVDPMIVTDGGKDINRNPPYGADVLRFWVAESNMFQAVTIGQNILKSTRESVNKIRSCFRFLLGNLQGFDPCLHAVPIEQMVTIDRYLHTTLHKYAYGVTQAYENYDYSKVTRLLLQFITRLSSFYFSAVKDRLYCDEKLGHRRLSCQTTLFNTCDVIMKSLAPILPHTVEEVAFHHPSLDCDSFAQSKWCNPQTVNSWRDREVESLFDELLLQLRQNFFAQLEGKSPHLFNVWIETSEERILSALKDMQKDGGETEFPQLREIFGSSSCQIRRRDLSQGATQERELCSLGGYGYCAVIVTKAEKHKCQRCRLHTSASAAQPCDRCANVMAGQWA